MAKIIVPASVCGDILRCDEGLSFWGGVDPETGTIVDAHHPQCGESVAGRIVLMPTSRGSCTGSGVLLGLALKDRAPAALIFHEAEDVLTLGALVALRMFGRGIAVVQLSEQAYDELSQAKSARITPAALQADTLSLTLSPCRTDSLELTGIERAMLAGKHGSAVQLAMQIICTMAAVQGARFLTPVSRVHIDGCIYASSALLTFAEAIAKMGARVCVPTTLNAISVDLDNWRAQGVRESFGEPASRLAEAYVQMGAQPSFTCAPYLLPDRPVRAEAIAWAESNAVVYANSVLGARTAKHPDFFDLCIALTGRAPCSGVYLSENRAPRCVIDVTRPEAADDAFWPLLGWLAGQAAPDRIPLITGLEEQTPDDDDLKALCAAFGTTSAAPLLHIAGVTPEADAPLAADANHLRLGPEAFARLWRQFNPAGGPIELVALGSPHFSLAECASFATLLAGRRIHPAVDAIVTLGRDTRLAVRNAGIEARLTAAGVSLVSDLCWCSISEPVMPPMARTLITNSGKYAHYGPGLSGRQVRFGSLACCAEAAITGIAPTKLPAWLEPFEFTSHQGKFPGN